MTIGNYIGMALLAGAVATGALLAVDKAKMPATNTGSTGQKPQFPNQVKIEVKDGYRVIQSNGIPAHDTGKFPGFGNPNRIGQQDYSYRMTTAPREVAKPAPLGMNPFGIAVNGVVFDPNANEFWDNDRNSGWQYEPLMMKPHFLGADASHAHVQPNGAYHYHGIPTALVFTLSDGKDKPVIIGWAADGFPIYNNIGRSDPRDAKSAFKKLASGYRVKSGVRKSGPGGEYDGTFLADYEWAKEVGDLDDCNGRFAITPEYPDGVYHYVLTDTYPFVPRQFKGTPDASFIRHPPGRGGNRGPDGSNGQEGRAGGRQNGGPGFRLIPRFAADLFDLSADQQKKVDELQTEVREKLKGILTPEQMNILETARPPRDRQGGPPPQ